MGLVAELHGWSRLPRAIALLLCHPALTPKALREKLKTAPHTATALLRDLSILRRVSLLRVDQRLHTHLDQTSRRTVEIDHLHDDDGDRNITTPGRW